MSSTRRAARRSIAAAALLAGLLVPGYAASAQEATRSPVPAAPAPTASAAPISSAVPTAAHPTAPSPTAGDIVVWPLPAVLTGIPADIPRVSVEPESVDDIVIGQAIDYALGHCGLSSPVDLDGSLWQAVAGAKADGSAIVEGDDEAIGELINATPGIFVLVDEDRAHFTTVAGTLLELVRAPGAVEYPLCM